MVNRHIDFILCRKYEGYPFVQIPSKSVSIEKRIHQHHPKISAANFFTRFQGITLPIGAMDVALHPHAVVT